MWVHILGDQLDVTAAEFWACVRDGTVPDRAPDNIDEAVNETIPAEVVNLLIDRIGLTRHDIAGMTRQQAIARLNEYRTTGR